MSREENILYKAAGADISVFALQYIHNTIMLWVIKTLNSICFVMVNRSAALHRGFAGGRVCETVRKLLAGSLRCTVATRQQFRYLAGGTLAVCRHTSFQVFQCDSNILTHAITSQKSPYSHVITNYYIFFKFKQRGEHIMEQFTTTRCLCWHPEMRACINSTSTTLNMVGGKPALPPFKIKQPSLEKKTTKGISVTSH